MRRVYLASIALAVVLFLAISAVLARVFSADGAERAAITAFVKAEAGGDEAGAVARIRGCGADPACSAAVTRNVTALRRLGRVSIIQIQASAGFSLGSTLGTARVAWDAGSSLPIVQCLRVRRAGNAFSGLRVELLAVTPRIKSNADCPARF